MQVGQPSVAVELSVEIVTVNRNVTSKIGFQASGAGGYRPKIEWSEIPDYVRAAIEKVVNEGINNIENYAKAMEAGNAATAEANEATEGDAQ